MMSFCPILRCLLAVSFLALAAQGAIAKPPTKELVYSEWFPGSSSAEELEQFPPAFRGKWAPDQKACEDKDGVNALFVYPNGLDTYESGGSLQRITQYGQDRTVLTKLAFEGEGGFWDLEWAMQLNADGSKLTTWVGQIETEKNTYLKCDAT